VEGTGCVISCWDSARCNQSFFWVREVREGPLEVIEGVDSVRCSSVGCCSGGVLGTGVEGDCIVKREVRGCSCELGSECAGVSGALEVDGLKLMFVARVALVA